jgi:phage FluMu protein Com
MLKVRCKMCNKELYSHPIQIKCCGCDNLTTVKDDKITALDLSLVELISNSNQKNSSSSLFSREDLAYQEARRNRKIRKMEFEIK